MTGPTSNPTGKSGGGAVPAPAVKERPILFSAPMVRALLDGSKTQTRRIVKPQPPTGHSWSGWCVSSTHRRDEGKAVWAVGETPLLQDAHRVACPYGQPGDRLWVRETWGVVSNAWDDEGSMIDWVPNRPATFIHEMPFGKGYYSGHVIYAADGGYEWAGDDDGGGEPRTAWHPSIHMPRAVSRILLEIVSVRVERLNDCSEADAKAEGVMQLDADDSPRPEARTKDGWDLCPTCAGTGLRSTLGAGGGVNFDVDCTDCDTHLKLYRHLWESINGAGSWDANPWVWVVEFKAVRP